MQLIYYEYYPFGREHDQVIILETPVIGAGTADRIIKHIGAYPGDYYTPITHNTLEAATARERGCEFTLKSGVFAYNERQGNTNNYDTEYCNFNRYMNKDYIPRTIGGSKLTKAMIMYQARTIELLKNWGYTFTKKVAPNGFDGCVCRECKGGKYMAEPDGLLDDGMLTCYTCKERLKSVCLWPYKESK